MPDINCTMDKITGLAAMFSPENMAGSKTLSVEACSGLCFMLKDCARELDQICRQYEEQEFAHRQEIEKLKDQLNEQPQVDILEVELAPVQREQLDKMVNLTGVSDDSLAQAMYDHGFETMDSLARMLTRKP